MKRLVACYQYETGKICTKAAITHPNAATRPVVAIMLKRLVCSGDPEKCFTHKMGYCISNEKQCANECAKKEAKKALAAAEESGNSTAVTEAEAAWADAGQCMSNCTYFANENAVFATEDEYTQAYDSLNANRNEIFVNGDGDGMGIHADWKCEEEDTKLFQNELMAF